MRAARRLLASSLVVACLAAAGGWMRLHGLEAKSLWRDEVETLVMASEGYRSLTRLALEVPYIPVPPLYFYAARLGGWRSDAATGGRLAAAIFGVLLIPAVWLLARQVAVFPAPEIAAGMTAFSAFLIRYSQEARSYTLLALLATMAAFFLVRAHRSGRTADWAGFALCSVLALYTHHFALLAVAAGFSWRLPASWREAPPGGRARSLASGWPAWAAVAAAWLPMAVFMARGLTGPRGLDLENGGANFRWGDLPDVLGVVGPAGPPWMWVMAALAAFGAVSAAPWKRGGRSLALIWTAVPLAVAALVPFAHAVRLRYLIFILPAWYILAASGLARLWLAPRTWPRWVAAALLAVLGASGLAGVRDYYREGKQDWRSVARFLAAVSGPRDLILVDGRGERKLNLRYRALDHYADLGGRIRIFDPERRVVRLGRGDTEGGRLWYVNILPARDHGRASLVPRALEPLLAEGWEALPPVKFVTPAPPEPGALFWIGPTRYRSLVVLPLAPEPVPDREGEARRLLAAAAAVPGAHAAPDFTLGFAGEGAEP